MKSMAKLIVTLMFMCTGAYADPAHLFSSPTAGFQVTKPAEWHYVTAEQNIANMRSMKLSDEEFHAAMQKYATAPLVAMTKHPEPYDDVNPSIKVNIKPFGSLKGMSPEEIMNLMLNQIKKAFRDFNVIQAPIAVKMAGRKAAYARMNYTMEIEGGRSFPTTSEVWIVPRGDYFFIIGAGTRQDEKTGTRDEIASILKTVIIEK